MLESLFGSTPTIRQSELLARAIFDRARTQRQFDLPSAGGGRPSERFDVRGRCWILIFAGERGHRCASSPILQMFVGPFCVRVC